MESRRAHRRRRARSSRRRPFVGAALASVLVAGGTAAGTAYVRTQAHADAGPVSSSSSVASPASSPARQEASVEPAAEPSADRDALLGKAMAEVPVEDGADVAVAVLDTDSDDSATYGGGTFDTASIVKVDILATLLLQAQDADRRPSAQEKTWAAAMIENSDNASASALWTAIGRAEGLDRANARFGLTHTAGGDGSLWGLTQTTAADQLTLLRQVFGDDSLLSGPSRTYLQGLMGGVAEDQRWGVSAAADGSRWALKNGWLARSTTGLWDINSIGRITADGHGYLLVTLSNGNSTKEKGIALVEAAARAAVAAFA
ncbi:serine hydrolase [Streptomyces sp. NPDC007264]|uniref:serine hydrolase n=1 Tax=Streptomyces sp. NPDC007264 TaxID=3364777 RepID=UPI0036DC2C75